MRLPALLILDVQKGFDDPYWGQRNNPEAEQNISRLLQEWRSRKGTVIFSQHLSLQPKSPLYHRSPKGTEFKDMVYPADGEKIFTKNVNSAFIGTELQSYLDQRQVKSVVITGLSTQHCVSTTTRMSGNFGYLTYLVSDATAAFEAAGQKGERHTAESIHEAELAMLNKEFATIITTDELLNQKAFKSF
ncbi:cysteine hydrolase [Bacillus salacetis]|uniref:Cysteine hydrolase n=1 Tax=Bacillus salacetis TaxID=2315464 RepID=A0A3A1QZM2_9BACI|nr:cysteine hydrolase family protein [Bacillus salacetis]RIW33659.1 cysteine hydrolase [Bacillus salacetis]